jgi:hypothetical protein
MVAAVSCRLASRRRLLALSLRLATGSLRLAAGLRIPALTALVLPRAVRLLASGLLLPALLLPAALA